MKTESSSAPLVFHADKVSGDLGAFVALGAELTPEGWAAVHAASITPEKLTPATAFRFPNVSCSQCGHDFGPGDGGFSSCSEHRNRPLDLDRKAAEAVRRNEAVAAQWGVRLPVRGLQVGSPIDDGGPAFPFIEPPTECNVSEGMSLRDHFASQALAGLCANPGGPFQASARAGWGIVNCTPAHVAMTAYDLADAMLKARAAS